MSKRIPIEKIVDFAAGRLSREESLALLDRIERDEQASEDLELIASMMDVVEQDGDTLLAERAVQVPTLFSRMRAFISGLVPKLRLHPVLSGVAAFACVFATLMILVPPSSPYSELASLREFDFGATVRGVELEEFELAFSLYREGRYEESIGLFERYIRAFPRSALLEYAHYSAGASYLRWSEWRFMSFFIGFDRERVQNGMDHLRTVVQVSRNSRLLEDTRWLIAKGHLMLSDPGPAMDELYLLMQMEGARRDEAAGMIGGLQAIQQKR